MDLLKANKNQSLTLLAVTSTTLVAYYLFRSNKENTEVLYDKIPVPKSKVPYFGHIFSLGELPGRTIAKWHREYGPIINIKMGVQNYITISDPELAHELLVTHGIETSDRPDNTYLNIYALGGKGIAFSNANNKWKKIRTAALEILSPRKVDDFVELITFEADNLVQQLLCETKKAGQINPIQFIQTATLNVILQTTFANRVTSNQDPLYKEILYNFERHMELASFQSDVSAYFPFLLFLDVVFRKERNMKHFVKTSYQPLIKKLSKEALENNKDCFYTRLLKMKEKYEIDDEDVFVAASDLLLGGGDTSSVVLTWTCAILSNYPDIQKKIIKEIDNYVTQYGQLPTFKDRDHFQYLITVIKEVMRFRPVTPLGVPHTNKKDVILRNYLIPKGSVLAASMDAIHMNPDVYDDPGTFNPDRFVNKTNSLYSSANGNINDRDQYNFGWGRRICPAVHLAESEMFYILTRLFSRCTIELPLDKNGNEIPVDIESAKDGIVIHPLPFEVRFIQRNDSLV
ncbi:cytochrome P450 [Cunninghamella echinulata]|nr:cytochrome P450 [Cunninghamella echinulata]